MSFVNLSLRGLDPWGQRWINDVSSVSLACPFSVCPDRVSGGDCIKLKTDIFRPSVLAGHGGVIIMSDVQKMTVESG